LIADSQNHRVREVSAAGVITTIAGIGRGCANPTAAQNACGDDGPALLAELDLPRQIALTPSGGFIVSDVGSNRVREVSLDGAITTIAGNGVVCTPSEYPCGDDGPALLAALDVPQDVVPSASGLLIADASEGDAFTGHNVIRVVSPTPPAPPQVTKLAGRAARVGKKGSRGDVALRGTFTVGAAIDLRATTVRVGGLLDEIDGAGELVSGLPLKLDPRAGTSRTVTFESRPSQRPRVRLRLKARVDGLDCGAAPPGEANRDSPRPDTVCRTATASHDDADHVHLGDRDRSRVRQQRRPRDALVALSPGARPGGNGAPPALNSPVPEDRPDHAGTWRASPTSSPSRVDTAEKTGLCSRSKCTKGKYPHCPAYLPSERAGDRTTPLCSPFVRRSASYCASIQLSDPASLTATLEKDTRRGEPSAVP
jgi:hypothetical protein